MYSDEFIEAICKKKKIENFSNSSFFKTRFFRTGLVLLYLSIPDGFSNNTTWRSPYSARRKFVATSAWPSPAVHRSTSRALVEITRLQTAWRLCESEARRRTPQPTHASLQVQSHPQGLGRQAPAEIHIDILRHSVQKHLSPQSSTEDGDRSLNPSRGTDSRSRGHQGCSKTDPPTKGEAPPLVIKASKWSGTPTSHRQRSQTQLGTERRLAALAATWDTPPRSATTGRPATIPNDGPHQH